jgi:hypothetical protein
MCPITHPSATRRGQYSRGCDQAPLVGYVLLQDGGRSFVFRSSQLLLRPSRRMLRTAQTPAYANGYCGRWGQSGLGVNLPTASTPPPPHEVHLYHTTPQLRAVRRVSSPVQSNVTFALPAATRFVQPLQPVMKPGRLELEEERNFCSIQNKTRPPSEITTRLRHAS